MASVGTSEESETHFAGATAMLGVCPGPRMLALGFGLDLLGLF